MPYYKISIQDKQGRVRNGIRYNEIDDIDLFYRKARQKAITALKSNFEDIEVVMLSRYSKELKSYLDRNKNDDKYINFPEEGSGIRRKGKGESNNMSWEERVNKKVL